MKLKTILSMVICVAGLSSCSESSEIESLADRWVGEWEIVALSGGIGSRFYYDILETGTYTFRKDGTFEVNIQINEEELDTETGISTLTGDQLRYTETGIFMITDDEFMLAILDTNSNYEIFLGIWRMSENHLALYTNNAGRRDPLLKRKL